ncbi:hypothetical protein C0J52_03236 [Blattella germanica]|nr:hypothetical protein C0J52_03236 [Blattella germanica]
MILNAYAAIRKDFPSYTIDQCVTKTAKMLFVSKATVYRIKAEWGKKKKKADPGAWTQFINSSNQKKALRIITSSASIEHCRPT